VPLQALLLGRLNDAIARVHGTRPVILDAASVTTLTWKEVEHLLGDAFRRRGYGVQALPGGGSPVDLVLSKDGEKTFVNCKHWKVWEVGDRPLAELYGYMSGAGAKRAVMVTTGQFSQKARDFAKRHNLRLIDGSGLFELVQGAA
jgi:restriction system protein